METFSNAGHAPQPRVGAASTVLGDEIYVFSGRGGLAMAPIEEQGTVWSFNPATASWSRVTPRETDAPHPEGRSYHAMTSNGVDTIYVHAGCPEKGRLDDLWSYDVKQRQWLQLASAPAPARGGPSIAYLDSRIYRMNGFDGKTEQGGSLDCYDVGSNSWTTFSFSPDGKEGPIARSVCGLLAVKHNDRPKLLTLFGESDPSNLGHAGAGKMLADVWLFDVQNSKWEEIHAKGEHPPPRGWFDADVVPGKAAVVVSGGLAESNERLDDVWLLEIE